MGHVGTFMMSFNLALECVGPKYRTVFGILIETPFAIGGLIVGLVSWAGVRDWKLLTLGITILYVVLLYWLTSLYEYGVRFLKYEESIKNYIFELL